MAKKIRQPNNVEYKQQLLQAKLIWKATFAKENTDRFNTGQKFVDSECIRLMHKYTPRRHGLLQKSPILGTKIGSGHIVYLDPKARYQFYGKLMVSSVTGSAYARRGEKKVLTDKDLRYTKATARALWFEVMKANHGKAILRGAAKIMGGKA